MAHAEYFQQQFADFFASLAKDQVNQLVILTPNKRLARYVRDQYSQFAAEQASRQGLGAWPSPACFSMQGWLQQQWDSLQVRGVHPATCNTPLTTTQELILWQAVIDHHPDTPALLNSKATAKLAMQAWRLGYEWQLWGHNRRQNQQEQEHTNPALDADSKIFQSWCDTFLEHCRRNQLIANVQLATVLAESFADRLIPAPATVILYGFDEHTPQQQHLLEAIQSQQADIVSWQLQAPGADQHQVQRHEFTDLNTEIEAAALWAKQINAAQPHDRIAIVAPQLAQQREQIERIFQRVFEPQYIYPQQSQHAPGFNISAGQPLDQMPLVTAALAVLHCNQRWLDVEEISQLLRSPFIGSLDEIHERALLDMDLRGHDYQVSFQQLKTAAGVQVAEEEGEHLRRCPDLYDRLDEFHRLAKQSAQAHYPSEWGILFCSQLKSLGWPGQRALDTLEYQQLQSWQQALLDFSALDAVAGRIDCAEAQRHLRTLLAQVSFQAQTKTSPIQILGILEAAGLPFDHVWILNLDDETWPPAPNPNPLLPIRLQVAHDLPQCSAQRELRYAQRLTARLTGSAHHVIYSHAKLKEDKEVSASPLILAAALSDFTLSPEIAAADALFASQEIEASLDVCGPKVTDTENIRGGSQLLKDQAACPFRAFAKHRLHSQEIPTTTVGLDASERGNLVHTVMEIIWRRLKHQARLHKLNDEELDQLIVNAINTAFVDIKDKRFIGERFLTIEAQRLARQIRTWLTLEKEREPFTVLFNEGRRTVKLGKLPLHIRYDRVDKLADGSLFVLDYKTGKQEIKYWAGERPEEPQVPLYCIANEKKVSGAGFGQIAADEIAIKGIAANEQVAPGLKTPDMLFKLDLPSDWPEIVRHWRTVLERLAQEFMVGTAQVDPKIPAITCRYCDLKSLCRIKEQFDLDADAEAQETATAEAGGDD